MALFLLVIQEESDDVPINMVDSEQEISIEEHNVDIGEG